MQAFNGDIEFKSKMVELALEHERQDNYVRRSYYDAAGTNKRENVGFRGCSVGCSLDSYERINRLGDDYMETSVQLWKGQKSFFSKFYVEKDGVLHGTTMHHSLAKRLGIPTWMANVQEDVFEWSSGNVHRHWTAEFLSSLPVGVEFTAQDFYIFMKFYVEELDEAGFCLPNLLDQVEDFGSIVSPDQVNFNEQAYAAFGSKINENNTISPVLLVHYGHGVSITKASDVARKAMLRFLSEFN